ncbi:MAG TPA: ATP-binding protein [Candidatus Lokiarchaeia archaeon]|nr:ATP-binding protein [Candidatus Lokiarchaeia archaeon]
MCANENKFFSIAMDAARQAVNFDRQGMIEEALEKYTRASESLLEFLKFNKNKKLQKIVEDRMEEYLARAAYLKKKVSGKTVKAVQSSKAGAKKGISEDKSKTAEAESEEEVDEDTKKLREMIADTIITEKPNVSWNDIAGLGRVKQTLREAIVLPVVQPQIFQGARKPWNGVLLFGPPGTGKTLMAKAAANECTATFYSADSASLMSKWLGESEKLIKTLFQLARKTSPSLIFIDEVDSLTSVRGASASEGGGERRLKTQLLQEMQGMKSTEKERILVLGATNRPWDLDPGFLRRFEKRIYIPLPDLESRREIYKIHTKGVDLARDVNFDELARISVGYSGSDISLVAREAIMVPLRELDISSAIVKDSKVNLRPVTRKDFLNALEVQKPVSTPEDVKHFKDWSEEFGV